MLSIEEINKLQKENEELKDELNKRIMSNNRLDYVVNNYHVCFDGALGAIQHLAKENLSNPKTVKHYINIALNYLSYRYNERGEAPNKYKQALEGIEEIVTKDYYEDNWAGITIKIDSIRNIINKAKDGE